jgi:hypothetical protein
MVAMMVIMLNAIMLSAVVLGVIMFEHNYVKCYCAEGSYAKSFYAWYRYGDRH